MNVTVCSCLFCVHMEGVLMVYEWSGLADMLANLIEKICVRFRHRKFT